MGFGDDINPIVKEIEPNLFCAVRCNGMGVAMGSLVGEEVAELAALIVCGKQSGLNVKF